MQFISTLQHTWRRSRLALGLATLGALAANPAQAQEKQGEAYTFSVKQAIDFALTHRDSVVNARLDEKSAQYKVKEVTGIGLPQINGSVELNDYLQLPTSLLPGEFFQRPGTYIPVKFGVKYNATVGLSASQLIFDGSYIVGLQASKTYVDFARRNTEMVKIKTAAQVARLYYATVVSKKRLGTLDATLERLQKTYTELQALNKNGFVEKLDVDRMNVTVTNLQVDRDNAAAQLDFVGLALKLTMGMPAEANLVLTDSLSESMFSAMTANADPNKRAEYQLLQVGRRLQELDLKRNRYGYLPSIAAYGSLSTQAQRQEFNFFDTEKQWFAISLIGVKMTVPIFDGLQKNYRIQQSKIAVEKADNSLNQVKNAISMQVQMAGITYNNLLRSLENNRRTMALAEEVVRVSNIKYQQGVGSNLEVTTAISNLREAQTNYYNTLYNLAAAQLDLQVAQGIFAY